MTGASWVGTAVLCWHLSAAGALPKEVPLSQVLPYASGERQVRVLILDAAKGISLRPSSDLAIESVVVEGTDLPRSANGRGCGETRPLGYVSAGALIAVSPTPQGAALVAGRLRVTGARFLLRPRQQGAPTVVSGRGGRGERSKCGGDLEIVAAAGGLRVVEHTSLESYVAGVVAAELPSTFPLEAAKAQAIAARTYALFHLGDHQAQGADLCGGVHCQAYRGIPAGDSGAALAARLTAAQVLAWNTREWTGEAPASRAMVVDAMYHAACGGATAPAWEARQGKLLPYLCGADDVSDQHGRAFCAVGHGTNWERRYSWREASRLVASNLGAALGDPQTKVRAVKAVRVAGRTQRGRAKWLVVGTDEGERMVRGDAIRWLFGDGRPGPRGLPSTAFDMEVRGDSRGRPRTVVFTGKGHGHGIGLCQWGARGRAESGETAGEILRAYYPGAEVRDLRSYGSHLPLRDQGDS